MVAYSSLTPQEQADIADMLVVVIPTSKAQLDIAGDADVALSRWNNGVSASVASLDPGEEIPNPTGLIGAGPVVKENLQNNIMAYITTLSGLNTQAHIDNITPIVGAQNVVSEP